MAVKVQYLGLESAVAADLSTLSVLGAIAAILFPNSFEFGCAQPPRLSSGAPLSFLASFFRLTAGALSQERIVADQYE